MGGNSNVDISINMINSEDEYKAWLTFAQSDYDSAMYLKEAPIHPKPFNIICYHFQQAAEKAAKALIVYYKSPGGMAKVHDVDFQLNQIKNILKNDKGITVSEELLEMASDISIYASEPRYPNELPVDETDVLKAEKYSKAIMEWVKAAINAPQLGKKGDSIG